MKRIDVKRKLDEIMESFHPNDIQNTYNLGKEEYELLINTVWQYSENLDEEEKIHPKKCTEMLRGNDSRDIYMTKVLTRLLKECCLFVLYKKSL